VQEASQYRWSSAGWATKGSPADEASTLQIAEDLVVEDEDPFAEDPVAENLLVHP
jgi:hypothetical protein